MYKYLCFNCKNLDKSKKEYSDDKYWFRYGCRKNKYVVGWMITKKNHERQLKEMGCSCFEEKLEIEQLSLF